MRSDLRKIEIDLIEREEEFIEYLDVNDLTIKSYTNGINSFISFLENNNIKYPTRTHFKAFREELKDNMSINTVNSYMTAIRRFFKYLELNGIYNDITKDVKGLKYSNVPKTQVLDEKLCKEIYNNLFDLREKCLFSLALTTGLRANELANAKIENIKNYNGEIVLFVKCKKRDDENEYVKLSNKVFEDIKNYIGNRTSGYIFISTSNNNKNKGVTNKTIRVIIKDILKRFGIEQDWVSCHTIRRTCATLLYENGQSVYDIQQVLHQKSGQTTVRYINQITRNHNKSEYILSNIVLGED